MPPHPPTPPTSSDLPSSPDGSTPADPGAVGSSAGHQPASGAGPAGVTSARAEPRWLGLKRGHAVALLLTVLVGGGIWFYEDVYEERYIAERMGQVEGQPLIFRSSQLPAPIVESVLQKYEIDVVVDLTAPDQDDDRQAAELEACRKLGIERFRFPMSGSGVGTPHSYADAITTIHRAAQAGQRVLVHCEAGTQRTGGVLSAYQMLVRGVSPAAAYHESLIYDWEPDEDTAWPVFLNDNMLAIAQNLVTNDVIETVPQPLPRFGP